MYDDIPEGLKNSDHWVCRTGKDGKAPCNPSGKLEGWQYPENWSTFKTVLEAAPRFAGIGYIIQREDRLGDKQKIGIDLDGCNDPSVDGKPSPWAKKWLDKFNSFTQPSLTGTGFHIWIIGDLPKGTTKAVSPGCDPSESGMPTYAWRTVKALKPKIQKANTAEIYVGGGINNGKSEGARHFAFTENRLTEYSPNLEERQEVLDELLKECLPADNPATEFHDWARQLELDSQTGRKLPKLDIMKIVDTIGWEETGNQIRGPHPTLGSTTGHNVVIDPSQNVYAYMHDGINRGGDAWVWAACMAGAVKWESARPGCLKDSSVIEKTIAYVLDKKWLSPDEIHIREPEIATVSINDQKGKFGVDPATGEVKIVIETKNEDGTTTKTLEWVTDWAAHVHTETREDRNGTEYTEYKILGIGSRDHIRREFVIPATDTQRKMEFIPKCEGVFGVMNRKGSFSWELVKEMSYYPIRKRRITVPCWQDNIPMVPGLGLARDVEFKLSQLTPALVYDGDLKAALELLQKLLKLKKFSTLLVTVILGSPVYARWFKNDRFGLALWGKTGNHKTTISKLYCAIYGIGYNDAIALVKHGGNNSTVYAEGEAMALAGILPRIIDNVKTTDDKEIQKYITLIHSTVEGGEKLQGKKDKGLRDITNYLTTPIVTGEVRPSEASTSARILNIDWEPTDSVKLRYIQGRVKLLPILGYHWLLYLATIDIDTDEINESQSQKTEEYAALGLLNPGRLANIYCLLKATWGLMLRSPLGDAIKPYTTDFMAELEEAIATQGVTVTSESEVMKFLDGVTQLRVSQSDHFEISDIPATSQPMYGKETDNGLFLVPSEILSALNRLKTFSQMPTPGSLTTQLKALDVIVHQKKGEYTRWMYQITIGGHSTSGWMLKKGWENVFEINSKKGRLSESMAEDTKVKKSAEAAKCKDIFISEEERKKNENSLLHNVDIEDFKTLNIDIIVPAIGLDQGHFKVIQSHSSELTKELIEQMNEAIVWLKERKLEHIPVYLQHALAEKKIEATFEQCANYLYQLKTRGKM